MKHKVEVKRLASPEAAGDWHDKPLKWVADGPSGERQKFSTRADAEKYATIRRRSANQTDALMYWLGKPL